MTGLVLVALAIWIKLGSKGPVFYRGERVGRKGKLFRILKFRSMVVDAEKIGPASTSDEDPRITSSGRFMRKCKLDELPQLINVLIGQMSLVGPRPEVKSEVDQYTDQQKKILQLRPGITDWASIWNSDEGAVLAGAEDPHEAFKKFIQPTKLALQLKYYHEHSLWVDIKIILSTILKIVRKDYQPRELRAYPPPQMTPETDSSPQAFS